VGSIEFPSTAEGIREIRSHAGRKLRVAVQRAKGERWERVDLGEVPVNSKGQIGFLAGDTLHESPLLSRPVARVLQNATALHEVSTPASTLAITPGSTLVRVGDEPIATLSSARDALARYLASASLPAGGEVRVPLTIRRAGVDSPEETLEWTLNATDITTAASLGYTSRLPLEAFELERATLRAKDPFAALAMGLRETQRVMLTTYLTFARLAEGTIRVEHLKGPVGIAHLGTLVAGRGIIWLLFFLALISVNLAVINFLPLPIVDGGQFLMLLYEAIRGRPVPIVIQNGVTMLGLLLIGSVFLFVTYNDIRNLFGV
jgi:regulator of sigma E protease